MTDPRHHPTGPSRLSSTRITRRQQAIGRRHQANNAAGRLRRSGLPDALWPRWRRPCGGGGALAADGLVSTAQANAATVPPQTRDRMWVARSRGSLLRFVSWSGGKNACRLSRSSGCTRRLGARQRAEAPTGVSFCGGLVERYRGTIKLSRVCSMSYWSTHQASYFTEMFSINTRHRLNLFSGIAVTKICSENYSTDQIPVKSNVISIRNFKNSQLNNRNKTSAIIM